MLFFKAHNPSHSTEPAGFPSSIEGYNVLCSSESPGEIFKSTDIQASPRDPAPMAGSCCAALESVVIKVLQGVPI